MASRVPTLPVWIPPGHYRLSLAILGVCRQLYLEGRSILYGENTIGIYICYRKQTLEQPQAKSGLLKFDVAEGKPNVYNRCITNFKRFEIAIELPRARPSPVISAVRRICWLLHRICAIKHLNIHYSLDKNNCWRAVLGPFGMLRNLQSVAFHGVPPSYTEGLTEVILGNTQSENLGEMYNAVYRYVGGFMMFEMALRDLRLAMVDWNVTNFVRLRARLLEDVAMHMEYARLHLYDFDAVPIEKSSSDIPSKYLRDTKRVVTGN